MMVLIEELFQQWDFSITLSAITLLFWNVETLASCAKDY